MENVHNELENALELRKNQMLEESKELLLELVKQLNDPLIIFECARAHDLLCLETQAIPYYEQAIQLGLPEPELKAAYTNLGSSYRCIGEYKQAEEVLLRAKELFPQDEAIKIFLAMAKYNLGKSNEAIRELLHVIVRVSKEEDIRGYHRAISFYADNLDDVWKD